jgi:tRNA pseudouridine38-40 synthase
MSLTFFAALHYDGGRFVGWQRQAVGRTVQGEVEGVLERLAGRRVVAHAAVERCKVPRRMGVSFSLPATWEAPTVRRAMNALLPRDCWIEQVRVTRAGFHARKSAMEREYRYDIGLDPAAQSPFRRPYEWALGRPLDLPVLREAAGALLGEHEFRAFAAKGEPKPHYRCRSARGVAGRSNGRGLSFHVAATVSPPHGPPAGRHDGDRAAPPPCSDMCAARARR